MQCPECQHENRGKAKFCNECGLKLSISSVNKRLDPSISQKTEGERKNATILFSDLSGYTAMTEKMDPEEIKNLMGDIFEKAGSTAVKHSKKVASDRTEAFRLMGIYFWLINNQKKALKWWSKSIKTGEQLGAKIELSRTYFEVGKNLQTHQNRYKELDGITAREYLKKAKTMFEEMDLTWDLHGLEKIRMTNE